jgi:hypothetical protein
VTGQLLAYQDGYVFFTTGDGFRIAPNIVLLDAKTGKPAPQIPRPRLFARATFDTTGNVTELDLSKTALPPEGSFANVHSFAVALSSPIPDPDLEGPANPGNNPLTAGKTFNGKPVLVTFTVQVPPNTPQTASIYITNDVSGWNPQAIALTRIDALHYTVQIRINSGTVFSYLYTRGSLQSEEAGENGLERKAREIVVNDADVRGQNDKVYNWADTVSGQALPQPNTIPTPYNPAPFPNLPNGQRLPGGPTPKPPR